MNVALGRVLSVTMSAVGWVLLGVRGVLEAIGYSTLPDDAAVAVTRIDQFLTWMMGFPWWAIFAFALCSTMWLTWVSWPRHNMPHEQPTNMDSKKAHHKDPLIAVHGEFFVNQRVVLDGKSHTKCTFEACTIVYNGSEDFRFSENTLRTPVSIGSDKAEIVRMMHLLHQLGVLKIPIRNEKGEYIKVEGVTHTKTGSQ